MRFLNIIILWLVCITGMQAQISVVPTVKHLTSTSTPSAGAINLVVSGGTSPYTYTWTPGNLSTKDITNRVKNTYVVKVKDNAASTVTYTYNIGYKADWDQMYGCISRNDSLINDASYPWSQAITKNNLAASTNGFVEYIFKGTGETKVFGVLDSLSPLPNTYSDIDYGYYYDGNLHEVVYGSLINIVWGGYPEGTALRVERSGSAIKFVVNGVTMHTVTDASAAAKVWKVKAMLWGDGAGKSFANMGCSFATKGGVTFKNYSNIVPFITHSAGSGLTDGSIRVKPMKTGTYTYTWQPGSVASATITSKAAGQYSLSARDASTTITPKDYNIGYKVKWDQTYACTVKHDTLITNEGYSWGSAISKNTLAGGTNGWFEYVLRDMDQYRIIGFTDSLSPNPQDIYDMDFGYYYEQGTLYFFGVGGYFVPVLYNVNEGTVLRVERRGDTIEYKLNGYLASSGVYPGEGSKAWKVKGTVYGANSSSLVNVGCSFYTEGSSSFPNYTRLIPNITHATNPTSNDGAIHVSPVQSGAYSYVWQPGATTGTSISSKSQGDYAVEITDGLGHENTVNYHIGYKVKWDQPNGALIRHDTLAYDPSSGIVWGTAISKNTLAGGTDGWMEYVFNNPAHTIEFGFLDSLSVGIENLYDIDYGIYYESSNGRLYVMVNGFVNPSGTINPPVGSVLRIERVADTIRLMLNGTLMSVFIDSAAAQRAWKIKGVVYAGNTSALANVGCSFYQQGYADFPNYSRMHPQIVHSSSAGANDGSVKVIPREPGTYNYLWQPGSVAGDTYASGTAGKYTVSIDDSLHHTNRLTYQVGYKTYWDSLYGVVVSGDTLKTTEVYSWGRAISKNTLAANTNGWFEYVLEDLDKIKLVGFLDSMSTDPQDIYDVDYGYYYDAVYGILYTMVKGSLYTVGQGVSGDILRIERKADTIMYTLNGISLGNIVDTVEARKAWKIKGIVHVWAGTKLVNVGCSFDHNNTLAVNPVIMNVSEGSSGRIDLNIVGGKPHYAIAWNGLKIADNHDFYLALDSTLSTVDSLVLYSKLDSLRRNQSLVNIPSAIYNNIIIDLAGDTLRETALVGNNFGWITGGGVDTSICVIPVDTAAAFTVHYGAGQKITKTAPGLLLKYAVSDAVIHPLEREFYTEYRIINDTDEMAIGFKTADSLNIDTITDMIQNTMIYMKGNGTNSMEIYYNSTLVRTQDYLSGDVIGILFDPLKHQIVYSRNFTPVWTQAAVPDAFFQTNYQLKAVLKTPGAAIGSIIQVGQMLPKRGISGSVTDVTCASAVNGSLTFNAYCLMFGEWPCGYSVSGPNGYSTSGSGNSAMLTGLSAGVYNVNVQIRAGSCSAAVITSMAQTFTVAYMPDWINQAPFGATNVNTTDRSFNITATQSSPYTWLGGASTSNMLDASEEGWAEFKPVSSGSSFSLSNKAMAFGLSSQDMNTNPTTIDHRLYVSFNPQLQMIGLGGGSSQSVGPYTGSMFSLNTVGAVFNVSSTDLLKIRKVPVSSGLNMKMEFYKNNILIGTGGTLPSTELIADVSVNQKDLYISKPRVTFGCDKRVPYYFILKKVLDAGYYTSYRKSIYFAFEEEYFDPAQGSSGSLSYTIVSDKNVPVSSVPGLIEKIGDNRYSIDLSTVSGMTQGEFYRIAITNKKNEVFYARFKY